MLGFDRLVCWGLTGILVAATGACSDDLSNIDYSVEATTQEDVPVDVLVAKDGQTVLTTNAESVHRVEIVDRRSLHITPAPDFSGDFDVAFTVSGGPDDRHSAIARIHVAPVNDPPVSMGDMTVSIYRATEIEFRGMDVDGPSVRAVILEQPKHGELSGSGDRRLYTPASDFEGTDSFRYALSDGEGMSAAATVTLAVTLGSAPTPASAAMDVDEDTPAKLGTIATDADNDPLTFTFGAPSHGVLTGAWPLQVYQPAANYAGPDAIPYTVSDGIHTVSASLAINVRPVNDAPVAAPLVVDATEDAPLTVALAATDVDGDALTFVIASQPQHGTVAASGSGWIYTPTLNYNGPDAFTYRASDGKLQSEPMTVTVNVAAVPDLPVASALAFSATEDTPTFFYLKGSDADGEPVTYEVVSQPAHGTVTGEFPLAKYTPEANYNGTDSFTYRALSNGDASAPAAVTLTIAAVNDAPTGASATVTTNEDTPVTIALAGSDVDGTTPTFIVGLPTSGTLSGTGATRVYTPAANANGTASFKYAVSDGLLQSSSYTITIAIQPVNDAPTAVDDYVATDVDAALAIDPLRNDSDIDGDALSLVDSTDAPAHGDAEVIDGKLTYTPDAGFTGGDTFKYTVRDASGATSTATIHVGVGAFPANAPLETVLTGIGSFDYYSSHPLAISGDGRFIAFTATTPLIAADKNNTQDVYLYDRGARTTTLISRTASGAAGNGASARPTISGDGRYIAYDSLASNLVTGDTNGVMDVFVFDRVLGTTTRASVAPSGAQVGGASSAPAISENGKVVAFWSIAFELIEDDANGVGDIFARDLTTQSTTRVSVTHLGGEADLASYSELAISGDGRYVAFLSSATNLVPGDTNQKNDMFVRDRVANKTTRVNVATDGTQANGDAEWPSMSRDGRYISFVSYAWNLVPEALGAQALVRDLVQSITSWPINAYADWQQLSGDGRYFIASNNFDGGLGLRDRIAAKTASLPAEGALWRWAVISTNGRYIAAHGYGDGSIVVFPNPL